MRIRNDQQRRLSFSLFLDWGIENPKQTRNLIIIEAIESKSTALHGKLTSDIIDDRFLASNSCGVATVSRDGMIIFDYHRTADFDLNSLSIIQHNGYLTDPL